MIAVNQGLLKDINRKRILTIIRNADKISRVEVKKLIEQDGKTVTNIVNSLMSDGLIKNCGYSAFTGGRRRELLCLNEKYGYTIGLTLDVNWLYGIITDFKSNIINREKIPIDPFASQTIIIAKIKKAIEFLILKSNIDKNRLLGIGFTAPGFYDRSAKTWVRSVNIPNLNGISIPEIISSKCSCSVMLEDISRAMALGEKWFGIAKNRKNYIFLEIGDGIGSGIIQGNKLYRGSFNLAGEIGHINVVPDGKMCSCGLRGCLETEASGNAVVGQAKEYLSEKGKTSKIFKLAGEKVDNITIEMIFSAAHDGDNLAIKLLNNAGKFLGIAIGNVISLFDPELIIVGGHFSSVRDFALLSLDTNIKQYVLPEIFEKVKIEVSSLGADAAVLGATTLILDKIFSLKLIH